MRGAVCVAGMLVVASAGGAWAGARQPIVQIEIEDDAGVVTITDARLADGYPDPASTGPHRLTLLDAAGAVLVDRSFGLAHIVDVPPAPDGTQVPPVYREHVGTTVNIPFPPGAALVRLTSGASTLERRVTSLRKASPAPAPQAQIIHQGCADENDCFKFLYVGDGYTQADLAEFATTAQAIADFFLAMEPYMDVADRINIYRLDNLADLGCNYNCSGIQRLICCNDSTVASVASAAPHDEVLVIVNDTQYGGSGALEWASCFDASSFAVTFKDVNQGAREVAVHETGHSMGGLWDEYDYGYAGGGTAPNCTTDDTCQQWAGTPGTGCFAGCSYSGYYRPTDNTCLMRTLSPTGGFKFCPVCIKHFQDKVAQCIGSPDAGYPDAGSPDAGTVDAGDADAGHLDSGVRDAGQVDAGNKDAGRADSGENDAGHSDTGAPDGGHPDGGAHDTGVPDAGRPQDDGGSRADAAQDGGAGREDATGHETDSSAEATGEGGCSCASLPVE